MIPEIIIHEDGGVDHGNNMESTPIHRPDYIQSTCRNKPREALGVLSSR